MIDDKFVKNLRIKHLPMIKQNHPMLPGPRTKTECTYCETFYPCDFLQLIDYLQNEYKWDPNNYLNPNNHSNKS